jgi:hypothetical protein
MDGRIDRDTEHIDHRTCVSICEAIGERLQQNMRLAELIDELRRRDDELH